MHLNADNNFRTQHIDRIRDKVNTIVVCIIVCFFSESWAVPWTT